MNPTTLRAFARLALLASLAGCSSNGGSTTPTPADAGPLPTDVPVASDVPADGPAADGATTDVPAAMDVARPTDAPSDQATQCAQIAAFGNRCRPDAACANEAVRALCLRYRPEFVSALAACADGASCSMSGMIPCPAATALMMGPGTMTYTRSLRTLCGSCPSIGASSSNPSPTVDQCVATVSAPTGFGSSINTFNDATLNAITECGVRGAGDGGTDCFLGVYNCLNTAVPEFNAIRMCSGM